MKLHLSVFAALLVGAQLSACETTAPTEQIKLFSDSFKAANDSGQPLLDDLAVAEREQGRVNAEARARETTNDAPATAADADAAAVGCPSNNTPWRKVDVSGKLGFIAGYCVDDAPYFADVGDPPATHAFREGLAVIGSYADVLAMLAEGRNLDEVHAQLNSLSSSVTGLLSFIPPAAPFAAAIGPALGELKPLIDAAAQAQNDREVRRLVIEGAEPTKKLIAALQAAAPEMFLTLTHGSATRATSGEALDTPALAKPEIEHIEAYRGTVSNFVVLLGELRNALDHMVAAAQNPGQSASLQSLADEAAKLQTYADAVRKAYSQLRRGA